MEQQDNLESKKSPTTYGTRSSGRGFNSPSNDNKILAEPMEEAAATILSRLDERSYERALVKDANTLLIEKIFPKCFPWYKAKYPSHRMLPKDIDDMVGLQQSGNAQYSIYGEDCGIFGFGSFDQGTRPKHASAENKDATKLNTTHISTVDNNFNCSPKAKSESCEADFNSDEFNDKSMFEGWDSFRAAARRSDDPGVIELTVIMPPPPSLEISLLRCQKHGLLKKDPWLRHGADEIERMKMLIASERAETSSCMPLYWKKHDGANFFCPPPFSQGDFQESINDNEEVEDPEGERLYKKIKMQDEVNDNEGVEDPEGERLYKKIKMQDKVKKEQSALWRSCTRRWYVSVKAGGVSSRSSIAPKSSSKILDHGVSISNENGENLPNHLQAVFPSHIQSGKSINPDILSQSDEIDLACLGSYNCSLISSSGPQTTDKQNGRSKRVNAGRTRLVWSDMHMGCNGKVSFSSFLNGQKHEGSSHKRPRTAKVYLKLKTEETQPIQSIQMVSTKCKSSGKDRSDKGSCYVDTKSNEMCTVKVEKYLQNIFDKRSHANDTSKKVSPQTEEHLFENRESIVIQKVPVLRCLPLVDGFFRVVCAEPGKIQKDTKRIHEILNTSAKLRNMCSVCWTNDETDDLHECIDCNLRVHLSCCLDKGELLNNIETKPSWRCAVCKFSQNDVNYTNQTNDSNIAPADRAILSRKSKRRSKIPARFTDSNENGLGGHLDSNGVMKYPKKHLNANCTICSFSGGAMSMINKDTKTWIHEVCRIWCPNNSISLSSPFSRIGEKRSFHETDETLINLACALCGGTESKQSSNASSMIKCAAKGCTVTFHPMCSIISSNYPFSLHENEDEDILKSVTFTLDIIQLESQGNSKKRSNFLEEQPVVVPIGFCGIHNPSRDKGLIGTPASPLAFSTFMNIPSVRSVNS